MLKTPGELRTLIDELLQEQQMLTAVSRFAQKHAQQELPLQSSYYEALIPLSRPHKGEQYRFEVDLDKCSGCKACVAACHSLNGLEEGESWRTVGSLISTNPEQPFQQTVTTACHHCAEPACSHGCPVLAYEKDQETGIVRHLDDQCIGCQYCVMKCPYEVPKYSKRLGIVRKCDLCANRLEAGEAPACVQACPNEAIRITLIRQEELKTILTSHRSSDAFLPSSPDPSYTIPATLFRSGRGLPTSVEAADAATIPPSDPHWPLVFMLILTQAGVGGFLANLVLAALSGGNFVSSWLNILSAAVGMSGLGASILHLGRPLHAWKAFLGIKRSWLSREIVVLGMFGSGSLLLLLGEVFPQLQVTLPALAITVLLGLIGVFTSVMVYHDTRREFWHWQRSGPRFFGTVLLFGSALGAAFFGKQIFIWSLAVTALLKVSIELATLCHHTSTPRSALSRTAFLQTRVCVDAFLFRTITILLFGFCAALAASYSLLVGWPIWTFIILVLLASEIAERYLFFRTVAQPKMPGGAA